MTGTLYLVATPIGNLEDMTPRGLKLLAAADIIAAEDTRHTLQLLNHFNLKGRLISYHEHNKEKQGPVLLQELQDGKNIVLVSDAGFPGIADPGEALVKLAVAAGITVVPVPGANAALTALVASGLPSSPFFFGGFLPKSKRNRKEQLAAWQYLPATVVLYEAPHRIGEVLAEILQAWGDRPLALGRELTKLHEEFWRGTVAGAIQHLKENPPRGEFVLVIAQGEAPPPAAAATGDPLEEVKELLEQGVAKKTALLQVAKAHKIPKRELYNKLIQMQAAQVKPDEPLQNTEEEGF